MKREFFVLIFLLTVRNLAHCQEWENFLFIKMEVLLGKQEAALVKQEAALSQMKGMQEKLEQVEGKLQEIQEKQEHVEGKLQEMQDKLQRVEINLQELHNEMEHLKGTATGSQDSLQRQQKLESFLRQEISGVISLLETGGIDECSEGSHNCTDYETCSDKLFKYQCSCLPGFARDGSRCEDVDECAQGKDECSPLATCRNSVGSYSCSCNPPSEGDGRTCDVDECAQGKDECSPLATCRNSVGSYSCSCNPPSEGDGRTCSCPPGFTQKGSHCEDIDECAQGKAECSPKATCRNSVGSYSCSCNPPFEGDGRTCEFQCRSPAKVLEGLGCVKCVEKKMTFYKLKATCHQAGGRVLQDFSVESLQEVVQAFGSGWRWIGVHEGRWLESDLPLQEELLTERSRRFSSSARRGLCGLILSGSSSLYKVGLHDCSENRYGYCQFINPQK